MLIGDWYCNFQRMLGEPGEWAVVYWTHGPRKCNECVWLVPTLGFR